MKSILRTKQNNAQAPLADIAIALSRLIEYSVLAVAAVIAYLKGLEIDHVTGMISATVTLTILVALMIYLNKLVWEMINHEIATS